MGRQKRGPRPKTKIYEKAEERIQRFMTLNSKNTTRQLQEYPSEFEHVNKSKQVSKQFRRHFKSKAAAANLPRAPETGIHVVKPSDELALSLPAGHPKVFSVRADGVVPLHVLQEILDAWDEIFKYPLVFGHREDKSRSSKSSSKYSSTVPSMTTSADAPTLHLGSWCHFQTEPYVTSDTQQPNEGARTAIKNFLRLVKLYLVPIIKMQLMVHSPNVWEQQKAAYNLQKQHINLQEWEFLDFEGAFFTIAAKEGSSDRYHIDFNDAGHSITWLVPFGTWEGGDFVAPQLKERIPLGAGQVLGAMTRKLVHAGSKITSGRRLVLTLFTDRTLVNQA